MTVDSASSEVPYRREVIPTSTSDMPPVNVKNPRQSMGFPTSLTDTSFSIRYAQTVPNIPIGMLM